MKNKKSPADLTDEEMLLDEASLSFIEDMRSKGLGKKKVKVPEGSVVFEDEIEMYFTCKKIFPKGYKNNCPCDCINECKLKIKTEEKIKQLNEEMIQICSLIEKLKND